MHLSVQCVLQKIGRASKALIISSESSIAIS